MRKLWVLCHIVPRLRKDLGIFGDILRYLGHVFIEISQETCRSWPAADSPYRLSQVSLVTG